MINSELIRQFKFDPFYKLIGDYDLWVRLSLTNNMVFLDSVVEYSRQHENNTSDILENRWLIERRYFYKKYLSVLNIIKYPFLLFYIFKMELLGIFGKR